MYMYIHICGYVYICIYICIYIYFITGYVRNHHPNTVSLNTDTTPTTLDHPLSESS